MKIETIDLEEIHFQQINEHIERAFEKLSRRDLVQQSI